MFVHPDLVALALACATLIVWWAWSRRSLAVAAAVPRDKPWERDGLDETGRFEAAVRSAPRWLAFLAGDEPQTLYGLYKQAKLGDAPPGMKSGGLKDRVKLGAWRKQAGRSSAECRADYVALLDGVATRAAAAAAPAIGRDQVTFQPTRCRDLGLRVRIVGTGNYVPERVVTNEEVTARGGGGFEASTVRSGVAERRFAAPGERASTMAAHASRAALEAAGVPPESLWMIVNASGTNEQAIPDGGPLLQAALGLGGSGIRSVSVHATCLSFLVGLEMASAALGTAYS